MDKPYLLRPWEIEKLTDMQIVELYYRKRDDKGIPLEINDEKHEWDTRKKIVTEDVMMFNKYQNFMKTGSMLGGSPKQLNKSWVDKFGKIPERPNGI